jgi:hypothetical protein
MHFIPLMHEFCLDEIKLAPSTSIIAEKKAFCTLLEGNDNTIGHFKNHP